MSYRESPSFRSRRRRTFLRAKECARVVKVRLPPFGGRRVVDCRFVSGGSPHVSIVFRKLRGVREVLSMVRSMPESLFGNRHFLASRRLSGILQMDEHALRRCHAFNMVPCCLIRKGTLCGRSSVVGVLSSTCGQYQRRRR